MKRVLIVDDNGTNLYMLETLLKGYGLEVTTAVNGKDALDKARINPPDLIITDILMPVMDGYTLCRLWKEDAALRHIPLIIYTATYTEPEDERLALSLGADRFVLKPMEPESLIKLLTEFEEKKAAKEAPVRPLGDEMEYFRQYNEILFKKLEKKMMDLETANQKLKVMEERYRLSFENVTEIICTIDPDFGFVSVSPSVEKILGYQPQEIIGRPVSDLRKLFTPGSYRMALANLDLVLKGKTIPVAEYQFISKGGQKIYGEVSGSPIRRAGRIIGMISVIRDITERKQAEKELEDSREMLIRSEKLAAIGQLSAGVAHEILNPLHIMSMKLEMLEAKERLSETTKAAIGICLDQIEKVKKISGDLQQFARVSDKKVSDSDINKLLEQVFNLITPRLKMEDVKLNARYGADLPLIPLDQDRVGQVIMNLINNAVDAMQNRPEKKLQVITELLDGKTVRISFSDTGAGISPEILNMIFNPFFTTKESGKGTGLGLSISYGIIHDHGGKIWAENNEEGGATFYLEFPVSR